MPSTLTAAPPPLARPHLPAPTLSADAPVALMGMARSEGQKKPGTKAGFLHLLAGLHFNPPTGISRLHTCSMCLLIGVIG